MKQKTTIFVTVLALLVSLTACAGMDGSTTQSAGNSTAQQEQSGERGESGGNTGSGMSDAGGIDGGNNGTAGADLRLRSNNGGRTGNGDGGSSKAADSAMYEHMLRNARVHDTDGDLRDNENSSFDTFMKR